MGTCRESSGSQSLLLPAMRARTEEYIAEKIVTAVKVSRRDCIVSYTWLVYLFLLSCQLRGQAGVWYRYDRDVWVMNENCVPNCCVCWCVCVCMYMRRCMFLNVLSYVYVLFIHTEHSWAVRVGVAEWAEATGTNGISRAEGKESEWVSLCSLMQGPEKFWVHSCTCWLCSQAVYYVISVWGVWPFCWYSTRRSLV